MNNILPYEDKLETSKGAFISPRGDFYIVKDKHESFAENYCNGSNDESHSLSIEGTKIYHSSHLRKRELDLYIEWLKKYGRFHGNPYSDFLVYFLHFDKVVTGEENTIITVDRFPHVRLYNYYLMEWYISQKYPMKLNHDSMEFETDYQSLSLIGLSADREAEEEINDIKKQIVLKKRPIFFR